MKDGTVTALDPDQQALSCGAAPVKMPPDHENDFYSRLNGVVWGGAADDEKVYYGLQPAASSL